MTHSGRLLAWWVGRSSETFVPTVVCTPQHIALFVCVFNASVVSHKCLLLGPENRSHPLSPQWPTEKGLLHSAGGRGRIYELERCIPDVEWAHSAFPIPPPLGKSTICVANSQGFYECSSCFLQLLETFLEYELK